MDTSACLATNFSTDDVRQHQILIEVVNLHNSYVIFLRCQPLLSTYNNSTVLCELLTVYGA